MTGFAASLVSTPALLFLGFGVPEVVVVNLTATLVTRIGVLIRLRGQVDRRRVLLLAAGSVPGAVAGVAVLGRLDEQALRIGTGVVVTIAGLVLLLGGRRISTRPGTPATAATGLLGGFLSTTTSLNGPPVAVLLDRCRLTPTAFVADFAGYALVTNAVSLALLGAQHRIPAGVLWPVLPVLVVAALVGNRLGGLLTSRVPAATFATIVKLLVIASGIATILS
ncbi:hypothetical protein AFB00_04630 [Pseudonocardia sp. HH130630-07]|nr:hypothetical protein AFB00_04630 [Pseudonocardia sp. HH130630-07]